MIHEQSIDQIPEFLSFKDFLGKETHTVVTIDGHPSYVILDRDDRDIVDNKLKKLKQSGMVHSYQVKDGQNSPSGHWQTAVPFIDWLFDYDKTRQKTFPGGPEQPQHGHPAFQHPSMQYA